MMEHSCLPVIEYCDIIPADGRHDVLQCATRIADHLGPQGHGIVGVRETPCVESLRRLLLPLAAQLANMDATDRKELLKACCLGTDLPLTDASRPVSSFTANISAASLTTATASHAGTPCRHVSSPSSQSLTHSQPCRLSAATPRSSASPGVLPPLLPSSSLTPPCCCPVVALSLESVQSLGTAPHPSDSPTRCSSKSGERCSVLGRMTCGDAATATESATGARRTTFFPATAIGAADMTGIAAPSSCSSCSPDGHLSRAGEVAVGMVLGTGSVESGVPTGATASNSTRSSVSDNSTPSLVLKPTCSLPHTCMAVSTASHPLTHLPCLIHSLSAHLMHVICLVAKLCDTALEQQQQHQHQGQHQQQAHQKQQQQEGQLALPLSYHAPTSARSQLDAASTHGDGSGSLGPYHRSEDGSSGYLTGCCAGSTRREGGACAASPAAARGCAGKAERSNEVSGGVLHQAVSEGTLRVRLLHYHADSEAVVTRKGTKPATAHTEPVARAPGRRLETGAVPAAVDAADVGQESKDSTSAGGLDSAAMPHSRHPFPHENASHALQGKKKDGKSVQGKKQRKNFKTGGTLDAAAGHSSLVGDVAGEELDGARLWQQWHCDYGLLTGLVPPLYSSTLPQPCLAHIVSEHVVEDGAGGSTIEIGCSSAVSEHQMPCCSDSCAQQQCTAPISSCCGAGGFPCSAGGIGLGNPAVNSRDSLHGGEGAYTNRDVAGIPAGLHVWHRPTGRAIGVDVPAECLAVICGETAQILSGGSLVAPAHCVVRSGQVASPASLSVHGMGQACKAVPGMPYAGFLQQCLSRDMFVVFSMPKRSLLMSTPACRTRSDVLHGWDTEDLEMCHGTKVGAENTSRSNLRGIPRSIEKVVPSLSCRWNGNEDFGEFAKTTTSFYYGKKKVG